MAIFWNIIFRTTINRLNGFVITFFVVFYKVSPIPIMLKIRETRKFINFKFLIFGRMGIIEDPLLKGNISADKVRYF